jgi:hypothetical protein
MKLSNWEVASRLSFLLWGTTPDDDLLDRAQRNELSRPLDVRAAAARMLESPRARERIARFHAMWLNYDRPALPAALAQSMTSETNALIEKVVFQGRRRWLDLFTADSTFVDNALARHYTLPVPGSDTPKWVDYGLTGRRGILSHGTFLSNGVKFGDTSPVQRGLVVQERLFCKHIPLPVPDPDKPLAEVDEPPQSTDGSLCKWNRYAAHRSVPECAPCHAQMDPVGFGLEKYDATGKYRSFQFWSKAPPDPQDPDAVKASPAAPETGGAERCDIAGHGELQGMGSFNGPGELGALAATSGKVDKCLVKQVLRFVVGRPDGPQEAPLFEEMAASFKRSDYQLAQLLLDVVGSPGFGHRVLEMEGEGHP